MKKKIVSLLLVGCLFSSSAAIDVHAEEVMLGVVTETASEEAAPESADTKTSDQEVVEKSVDLVDEAVDINEPDVVEADIKETDARTDEAEMDEVESEEATESETNDEVADETTDKITDTTEEKIEIENLDEVTRVEDIKEDEVVEKEIEVESEIISTLSTIYELTDDNAVIKKTRVITKDGNENSVVEDKSEEIGYLDENGDLYVKDEIQTVESKNYHITVNYTKEIEEMTGLVYTGNILTPEFTSDISLSEEKSASDIVTNDADVQNILSKIDFPETLESGVAISAKIDLDGNITIESAVATEPEVVVNEIQMYALTERDFEFGVEYTEEEYSEIAIEESAANDTENANASESDFEPEEIIAEIKEEDDSEDEDFVEETPTELLDDTTDEIEVEVSDDVTVVVDAAELNDNVESTDGAATNNTASSDAEIIVEE